MAPGYPALLGCLPRQLRPEPLRELDAWLTTRTSFWTHQLDALDAALDQEKP